MAVVQISKIQIRRGQENQTGVPLLAGGEFAWAADTEQLYIGLKREDGGARDANVRILTENDLRNFFASSGGISYATGAYTYRSGTEITVYNSGTSIQTEYSSGVEFVRSLQDRLDEFVSVKNFGVTGDGGDNTEDEYIQLAIDRLFASTASEYAFDGNISPPAKILYFPAGHYSITGTIYLPANTTIMGEGIDKTIFTLKSNGEHIFQTVDVAEYRSSTTSPPNGLFTITNVNAMSTPYIPRNIHIEGVTMQFETTSSTTLTGGLSLISLDCAENAVIRRVKFKGNFNETKIADENYAAIDLRGYTEEKTTRNIVIDDCEFTNLYNGIKSNFDVSNIVVQNSFFYKLTHGVSFNNSKDPLADTGPRFARIINNKFQDIQDEAIYAGTNSSSTATGHLSLNNQFLNVGNKGQNEMYSTGTSVITFLSKGNASVNDYFDRQNWQDQNGGTYTYNPLINGRAILERSEISTVEVATGNSEVIMRLPITEHPQHLTIKYSCSSTTGAPTVDRMGTVQFYIKEGTDPEIIISDEYNAFSSDGALYWGATVDDTYKLIEIKLFNPSLVDGGSAWDVEIEFQTHLIM